MARRLGWVLQLNSECLLCAGTKVGAGCQRRNAHASPPAHSEVTVQQGWGRELRHVICHRVVQTAACASTEGHEINLVSLALRESYMNKQTK